MGGSIWDLNYRVVGQQALFQVTDVKLARAFRARGINSEALLTPYLAEAVGKRDNQGVLGELCDTSLHGPLNVSYVC